MPPLPPPYGETELGGSSEMRTPRTWWRRGGGVADGMGLPAVPVILIPVCVVAVAVAVVAATPVGTEDDDDDDVAGPCVTVTPTDVAVPICPDAETDEGGPILGALPFAPMMFCW